MVPFKRPDGRRPDQIRPCQITRGYLQRPPGAVLIECGETRIVCTATVVREVPDFLNPARDGWLTAEYGMLPGSTHTRKRRDRDGRTSEIQRLIGRALRAVADRSQWPGHTIYLDCDVLQADGGTRTASITGAYVALADAVRWLQSQGRIAAWPLRDSVAAISVGIVQRTAILDLDYAEDSMAEADFNVVMTGRGEFIEVQGTGEKGTFTQAQLSRMLRLARQGIRDLFAIQEKALKT